MGLRGPKPKGKVRIKWSPNFAYALGLLATDGCLSGGRHICLVSKDREQLENFMRALQIHVPIGKNVSGYDGNITLRVQFSDVLFYRFLESIGIMPNKSKILGEIGIPDRYFFDFLRGSFDGDGCTYSYMDPRWCSSFMFYTVFASASKEHVIWLQNKIRQELHIDGHITGDQRKIYQLKYAKQDSLKLLQRMYHSASAIALSRKRLKNEQILRIVQKHTNNAQVVKLVDTLP